MSTIVSSFEQNSIEQRASIEKTAQTQTTQNSENNNTNDNNADDENITTMALDDKKPTIINAESNNERTTAEWDARVATLFADVQY
jgi:hypothetical protein